MNVLDKAGLTKLWAKIKEKFATKSELGLYVGGTNSLKATHTNTDLKVTLNNANGSLNTELTIGCATTEQAGIMSAKDKKTLNIVSDMKYQNMSYILYSELKNLRDNSQLVEGRYYRITDFVTTVDQKDAMSAGHAFDIIVLAASPNTLNENAFATQNDDTTYFSQSNLDAWELKYDLDNDKSKYAWADETNGKGVIYYMKDEFNNECFYDFKNVQYKRYSIDATKTKDTGVLLTNSNSEERSLAIYNTLLSNKSLLTYNHATEPLSYWEVYPELDQNKLYVGFGDVSFEQNGADVLWPVNEDKIRYIYTFNDFTSDSDASLYNLNDKNINNKITFDSRHGPKRALPYITIYGNNNIVSPYIYNTILSNMGITLFGNDNIITNCHGITLSGNSNILNETHGSTIISSYVTIDNESYDVQILDSYYIQLGYYCMYCTIISSSGIYFGQDAQYLFIKNSYYIYGGSSVSLQVAYAKYLELGSGIECNLIQNYTTGSSAQLINLEVKKINGIVPANLITLNANYSQVLGLNSSGGLVCKPALD